MFTLLTFITTFLLLTNYSTSAEVFYNPADCNFGDETEWHGPDTLTTFNLPTTLLGCPNTACTVKVIYYWRETAWGFEASVQSISFSSNCNSNCYQNAYSVALWMITIQNMSKMGLNEVDDCYYDFTYRMSTCWQTNTLPFSWFQYIACSSECCVSTYRICLIEGTINNPNIELYKTSSSSPISNNCISPCQLVDCNDSAPNLIITQTKQDDGSPFVFYPKQNVNNDIEVGQLLLSPNVVNDNLNVTISNIKEGNYTLKIYDNIGNSFISTEIQIQSANTIIKNFDIKELPTGKYNLLLYNKDGFIQNKSFIIVK